MSKDIFVVVVVVVAFLNLSMLMQQVWTGQVQAGPSQQTYENASLTVPRDGFGR